jgi:Fe-Mn family superoxide dismutase
LVAPAAIDDWADELPRDKAIVVYCLYGFQVSGEATVELRRRGLQARALTGGITAWRAMAGPTVPLPQSQFQGGST